MTPETKYKLVTLKISYLKYQFLVRKNLRDVAFVRYTYIIILK